MSNSNILKSWMYLHTAEYFKNRNKKTFFDRDAYSGRMLQISRWAVSQLTREIFFFVCVWEVKWRLKYPAEYY